MDWKNSLLKKRMEEGFEHFNEDEADSQKWFNPDEIEYTINILRYNSKDFT